MLVNAVVAARVRVYVSLSVRTKKIKYYWYENEVNCVKIMYYGVPEKWFDLDTWPWKLKMMAAHRVCDSLQGRKLF